MIRKISLLSSIYNCACDIPYFVKNSRDNASLIHKHYVINDGSQDKTDSMIRGLTKNMQHISYQYSNENKGLFPRKHELSELADTDYVVGLSHDDGIVPGYLNKVQQIIDQYPGIGLVFCNRVILDENGNYTKVDRPTVNISNRMLTGKDFLDFFILPNWPYHSQDAGAVMNLAVMSEIYSDFVVEKLGAHADVFFMWILAFLSGAYHLNEVGHVLKFHPGTWSGSSDLIQKEMLAEPIVECILYYQENGLLPGSYARILLKRYVPLISRAGLGKVY